MKIIQEILTHDLILRVHQDFQLKFDKFCWRPSAFHWQTSLLEGVVGATLVAEPDDDIASEIKTVIAPHCSNVEYTDIAMVYHMWMANAGIAMHRDDTHKWGATIYLNPGWNINHGGLFVWDEGSAGQPNLRAVMPKHNMCVINDSHQYHMVTPVSPVVEQYRYTIQMFGR